MNALSVTAPNSTGGLSSLGFRAMDRALTNMEQQGEAIINMMDEMAVAQYTGQGINVNLAV